MRPGEESMLPSAGAEVLVRVGRCLLAHSPDYSWTEKSYLFTSYFVPLYFCLFVEIMSKNTRIT